MALFIREGDHLSCFSSVTFAKSFDKAKPLSLDGTLAGWVVKHREPLIIGNFDKDEETLGYYGKKEEIKSFMAYPLEMPGVIVVDSKKKWIFTEKEKKILAHFVTVASKEVEREKQLREMEEEREEFSLLRRQLNFLRQPRLGGTFIEEVVKEALAVSAGDMAVAGIERKGRLSIVAAVGTGAASLLGAECPLQKTVASTVMEGGRELLLPYESGYLREKPLLFQNDGIRARQYFGFPLVVDERPFGFLGFVSLSSRPLRENSISALRDTAHLTSLFLGRVQMREEMEALAHEGPRNGRHGVRPFLRRHLRAGEAEERLFGDLHKASRLSRDQQGQRVRIRRRPVEEDAPGHRLLRGKERDGDEERGRTLLRCNNRLGWAGRRPEHP